MADFGNMIEDCISASTARNTPFNDWEIKFIESIHEQWARKRSLSPKQEQTLRDMWDKI